MEEKIKAIIEAMDDDGKIALWNESCRECNCCDDAIYSMSEFDEIMGGFSSSDIVRKICDGFSPLDIVRKIYDGFSPSDIVRKICGGGNFNPNSAYFYFDGNANLVSIDYPDAEESPFYLDDLVDRIMQHENAFGCDEIAAVLNSEDDEEDDEED